MKRILVFLVFFGLGICQPLFAQQSSNQLLIQEYIKQSERQKKTGLIMLGTGLGSTIIGAVMFGAGWGDGSDTTAEIGAGLMVAGVLASLISVPILVSSSATGRKAGKLSLGLGEVQAFHPFGYRANSYPAMSFSLPLNQKP